MTGVRGRGVLRAPAPTSGCAKCSFASAACPVCVQQLPLKRRTAEASASEGRHALNWAQALVTLRPVGRAATSGAPGESCFLQGAWYEAKARLWGAMLQADDLHRGHWAASQPPKRLTLALAGLGFQAV